jgi:hypothetical protein
VVYVRNKRKGALPKVPGKIYPILLGKMGKLKPTFGKKSDFLMGFFPRKRPLFMKRYDFIEVARGKFIPLRFLIVFVHMRVHFKLYP